MVLPYSKSPYCEAPSADYISLNDFSIQVERSNHLVRTLVDRRQIPAMKRGNRVYINKKYVEQFDRIYQEAKLLGIVRNPNNSRRGTNEHLRH